MISVEFLQRAIGARADEYECSEEHSPCSVFGVVDVDDPCLQTVGHAHLWCAEKGDLPPALPGWEFDGAPYLVQSSVGGSLASGAVHLWRVDVVPSPITMGDGRLEWAPSADGAWIDPVWHDTDTGDVWAAVVGDITDDGRRLADVIGEPPCGARGWTCLCALCAHGR